MKTAIFGGSFDPPHLGHEKVIREVADLIKPDRFLIIPAYVSPFKTGSNTGSTAEDRLNMCRLAFGDIPGTEISDMEIRRGGSSYTYDTVTAIKSLYPDDELFLVTGSDQLLAFRGWYRYRDLLDLCTLVVFAREEGIAAVLSDAAEALRADFGARIILSGSHPLTVSSTEIRSGLSDMIAPRVAEYIRSKNLYTV